MKKFIYAGLLGLLASTSASALTITNGSFETGDLATWANSNATVTTMDAGYTATDGSYFAKITSDGLILNSQIWDEGEQLSFDWNFNTTDYMPFNDYSFLKITDVLGNIIDDITLADVSSVGDYGATDWQTYVYTFAETGSGLISFGVSNIGDDSVNSYLYVDNVSVPAPASLTLLSLALFGFAFSRRRKV
ncbi:PEP-CTERM sorting domain-containing protein [Psychromonas sp. PT13]|uniref:PEP-CTERM sorting domain-containing protein n=1 Tax=Psychromonas sp. PT13 TaxID=3439547 RepID=UPI003EBC80CC